MFRSDFRPSSGEDGLKLIHSLGRSSYSLVKCPTELSQLSPNISLLRLHTLRAEVKFTCFQELCTCVCLCVCVCVCVCVCMYTDGSTKFVVLECCSR
jgi:hypothetical protein